MFQLVCALIAIALTATTMLVAVTYLSPAAVQAENMADGLERGLRALKSGYQSYVNANPAMPDSMSDITPEYVFIPPAPPSTQWLVGAGATGGRYFCWSGDFTAIGVRAIRHLRNRFSPQAYFINTNCGATTDALPAPGQTFSGAVTLWVAPY